MTRNLVISILLLFIGILPAIGQSFNSDFVKAINSIRQEGCHCGGKFLSAAGLVGYNDLLALSAYNHARDIRRQRRLNHFSSYGLNIGQRIDKVGYRWHVVGENLAFGHESIDEVLDAWVDSETHCQLLMDDRFEDVGFAKLGPYWVLHFGKTK